MARGVVDRARRSMYIRAWMLSMDGEGSRNNRCQDRARVNAGALEQNLIFCRIDTLASVPIRGEVLQVLLQITPIVAWQ